MRFTSVAISLLPLLTPLIGADQAPIQEQAAGWLDKAKGYIPNSAPVKPIEFISNKFAADKVERITKRNVDRKLAPKLDTEQEWVIYVTGGNKTCQGRCGKPNTAWNESIPLLAALPQPAGSPELKLGYIDCEADDVMCTAWALMVPCVYHFMVPQSSGVPGAPKLATPLHVLDLNVSSVTPLTFASIPSTSKATYLKVEEYIGAFHPIDGSLKQYNLLMPLGWVLWGFGSTPSWGIMVCISFFTRQYMSRKMMNRQGGLGAGGAPAPQRAQPAVARPAAPAAAPAGGAQALRAGGKKRR